MAVVLGIEFPVLEFLFILNIIMLFYVIISMFEIRSLVKLRKDLELLLQDFKIGGVPTKENKKSEKPVDNAEVTVESQPKQQVG